MPIDLSRANGLEDWLDGLAPDWIVNCAALARAAECERDPAAARELNARLPGRLARWCSARAVRLVHVSTDLVFEGRPPRPAGYREDDPARPESVYGRSKLAGEEALLAAAPGAVVVRLPLLFGDSGGRGLGASDAVVEAVARGDVPLLFTDELRSALDVEQAAQALLELATGDLGGRLHVAGPRSLSRHELGILALRAAGHSLESARRSVRPALRSEVSSVPPRPRDVSLDASLARSLLSTRLSPAEQRLPRQAGPRGPAG